MRLTAHYGPSGRCTWTVLVYVVSALVGANGVENEVAGYAAAGESFEDAAGVETDSDKGHKMEELVKSDQIRVNCARELEGTNLTALWHQQRPYAYMQTENNMSSITGIVYDQLMIILQSCCSEEVDKHFTFVQYASRSSKNTSALSLIQRDLMYGMASIGFPMTTPQRPNIAQHFVAVLPSPGAVYMVVNDYMPASILTAVTGAWVLLCFVIASAALAGTLIWLVESHDRRKSMFSHDFLPGIYDGFWFSIVTMTSVGFGDITPRTKIGKLLGLLWMMVGTISLAIFTATITTSLTTSTLNVDTQIRGAKVAVIAHSESSKIAILNGAVVKFEAFDANEAIAAVLNGTCEGVVMDQLVAGDLMIASGGNRDIQRLRLAKLLMSQVTYGILFSPNRTTYALEQCADVVMANQEHTTYVDVEELIAGLQARQQAPSPSVTTASIYSQHKNLIYYACYSLAFVLLFALVLHQLRLRSCYPTPAKRHHHRHRHYHHHHREAPTNSLPSPTAFKPPLGKPQAPETSRLLQANGAIQYGSLGSTAVTASTTGTAGRTRLRRPSTPATTSTTSTNGDARGRLMARDREQRDWSPLHNPVGNADSIQERPMSVDTATSSSKRKSSQANSLSSSSTRSLTSSREGSPVAIAPKQRMYMRSESTDLGMLSGGISAATSLESIPTPAGDVFTSHHHQAPPTTEVTNGNNNLEELVLSEQTHELERLETECHQMLEAWSSRRRQLMFRHRQERSTVRLRQQSTQADHRKRQT